MIKTTATMTSIDGDRDPLFAGGQAKRGCSGRCGGGTLDIYLTGNCISGLSVMCCQVLGAVRPHHGGVRGAGAGRVQLLLARRGGGPGHVLQHLGHARHLRGAGQGGAHGEDRLDAGRGRVRPRAAGGALGQGGPRHHPQVGGRVLWLVFTILFMIL